MKKCGSAAPFDGAHSLFEPELQSRRPEPVEGLGGGTATGARRGGRHTQHGRTAVRPYDRRELRISAHYVLLQRAAN